MTAPPIATNFNTRPNPLNHTAPAPAPPPPPEKTRPLPLAGKEKGPTFAPVFREGRPPRPPPTTRAKHIDTLGVTHKTSQDGPAPRAGGAKPPGGGRKDKNKESHTTKSLILAQDER